MSNVYLHNYEYVFENVLTYFDLWTPDWAIYRIPKFEKKIVFLIVNSHIGCLLATSKTHT